MDMTGAQLKELAEAGFDKSGDGNVYPYVPVTCGGAEPEDDLQGRVCGKQLRPGGWPNLQRSRW